MKKLVLLAHPDYENSKANSALINAISDLDDTRIINVCTAPMVAEEYAQVVSDADIIIMQFPFYWGGAPYALKEWIDKFLFSFMQSGLIANKPLMTVVTTGSLESAYRSGGYDLFTMDEILRPFQFTANYSGMKWTTPFIVYGCDKPGAAGRIRKAAKEYRKLLSKL